MNGRVLTAVIVAVVGGSTRRLTFEQDGQDLIIATGRCGDGRGRKGDDEGSLEIHICLPSLTRWKRRGEVLRWEWPCV